jgi:hypothetical protein
MSRIVSAIEKLYLKIGADFRRADSAEHPPIGRFPSVRQSLLWDLLPSRLAPDADGLLPPKPESVEWIRRLREDDLELILSITQSARSGRQDSINRTEAKASRLLTPTITLLAACAALSGYQLNIAGQTDRLSSALTAIPSILGISFFMFSALRSLDADIRVGFYKFAGLKEADAELSKHDYLRECIRHEVLGEFWAKWTSASKATSLMQARAWFSRGLIFLVLALLSAAVTQLVRD